MTTLRYLSDEDQQAGVYDRVALRAGDELAGPAIVNESLSTTHIGAGQIARVGAYGELVISKG
jgi:N-methylhydantoinase A